MTNSYMICTSPRSGSTLLCRMLTETGVAGAPESLFFRPDLQDWAERLGVENGNLTSVYAFQNLFQAAIVRGRANTPVFALRQQWPSFAFLCQQLALLHPNAETDQERIERVFGPMRFIYLSRADKVAQAVSFLKAEQSGLWHVARDGSELERTHPAARLRYDPVQIGERINRLRAYDRGWLSWFKAEEIKPISITYENLSKDPPAILRDVLCALGFAPSVGEHVTPSVQKMSDRFSEDWIERFLKERKQDGGP